MTAPSYIKVLLPLNLSWMPTYSLPDGMSVRKGDRVKVKFANREYVGVAYGFADVPDLNAGRILPVIELPDNPPVSSEELELWEFVSGYYLCPMGEVCKVASPASVLEKVPEATLRKLQSRNRTEPVKPRLTAPMKQAVRRIVEAFDEGKNVLLCTGGLRRQLFQELSRRVIESGKDVLILRPEISTPSDGMLCYASMLSPTQRRNAVHLVRNGGPQIVEGESPAVFLPFRNLGLVIVDDEFSQNYKQSFHQPFYNARDVAFVLAGIWNAPLLLCAEYPSLESLYNCSAGRLVRVEVEDGPGTETQSPEEEGRGKFEIIDVSKEKSKNGMVGNFSRIALSRMEATLQQKGRILLLQPWKDTSDIEIEARKHFPSAGSKINSMPLSKADSKELAKYSLVLLTNIDFLLSRQDFRADEYAFRQIERLKRQCSCLLVQTSESGHYVFDSATALETMLAQRREFQLPPYTREVRIKTGDSSRSFFLPKDRNLAKSKAELLAKAPRGAIVDVDP